MAGKIQINRITNANIYLDGNNLLGRATEIKLPDVSLIMQEHKALGMVGKIELPAGFDKLEGEIKWNSFYQDVMRKTANPWQAVALQCRSSIDCYNSQGKANQLALVTHLTVMFKRIPWAHLNRMKTRNSAAPLVVLILNKWSMVKRCLNLIIWRIFFGLTAWIN